jgi:hypothetical protein
LLVTKICGGDHVSSIPSTTQQKTLSEWRSRVHRTARQSSVAAPEPLSRGELRNPLKRLLMRVFWMDAAKRPALRKSAIRPAWLPLLKLHVKDGLADLLNRLSQSSETSHSLAKRARAFDVVKAGMRPPVFRSNTSEGVEQPHVSAQRYTPMPPSTWMV